MKGNTLPPARLPAEYLTGCATAEDFETLTILRMTVANGFALTLTCEQLRAVLRLAECGYVALEGLVEP